MHKSVTNLAWLGVDCRDFAFWRVVNITSCESNNTRWMERFNVKHCMYTKKIGITTQHNSRIKITEKDVQRVRRRLKEASNCGLQVIEKALSTEHMLEHVRNSGPAIVLVNARLLACDWCKRNKLTSELRFKFHIDRSIWGGTYQGHYIILVSQNRGKILYRDPASSHRVCATTARRLDYARSNPGTDHDVILVKKT